MLIPDPLAQAYAASYVQVMKKEAAQLGVNVIIDESNYTASVQQSQMQELIAKKVNGIILFPAIYGTTASMLTQAKAANIPVNISNSVVSPQEAPLYHTFTGPSNVHLGELQAKLVNKLLGGHGNIIYITGQPGNSTAIQREQGLKSGLAKGITILGTQPGNWLQAPSETATANLLTRFGSKVNLVVAADDTSAAGSAQAIKNAGLTGKVKLVGSGYYQVTPPLMKSGQESATLFQSPCWDAVTAMQKMAAVVLGQSVSKNYIMPLPSVTQSNYKKFTPMGCLPGTSVGS